MGLREQTDSYFGTRVRAERERRNWSQDELAKRLTDMGVPVYASTIAKIESDKKPRAVRLGEATSIADLFGVSLDTLLGRSVAPKNDRRYALRVLAHTAQQASSQMSSIETTLRDRVVELAAFHSRGWINDFESRCERACDQLAEANTALRDALEMPGSREARGFFRKMLREELTEEERLDETQS